MLLEIIITNGDSRYHVLAINVLFEGPICIEALRKQFHLRLGPSEENRDDIYGGEIYQDLVKSGFLQNPHNLTLVFNTDGIPVFRSSSFSFWPLHLIINELPFRMRYVS